MMRISYGLWEEKKNNCRPGVYKGLASSADIVPVPKLGNINFCGGNSNNCVIFSASAQQPRLKSFIILTR